MKSLVLTSREEIKWKFQMLVDSLRVSTEEIENQMKSIDEGYRRDESSFKELRTIILGGISFGAMFMLTLITGHLLPIYDVFYILSGLAIGVGIFVIINSHLFTKSRISNSINMKYEYTIKKFNAIRQMVYAYSMNESMTVDNVTEIIALSFAYEDALRYNLILESNQLTKSKQQVDQEQFRNSYTAAKSLSQVFTAYDMTFALEDINKFIESFEDNDKKSSHVTQP